MYCHLLAATVVQMERLFFVIQKQITQSMANAKISHMLYFIFKYLTRMGIYIERKMEYEMNI